MKNVIYIIFAITIAAISSCTVWQSEGINNDISRPGTYVNIMLKDSSVHFVFDDNDILVRIYEYTPNDAMADTIILLDGVPDVEYKMVSYFNYNQYSFSNMVIGRTKYTDTKIILKGATEGEDFKFNQSADMVCHDYNEFQATWGEKSLVIIDPKNKVYSATVKIESEDGFDFWREMTNFSIDFTNMPSTIEKDGKWIDNNCTYSIKNFTEEGEIATVMQLPRFEDNHRVEMHAIHNDVSIGSLPVTPSIIGISPNDNGEVKFTITLYINPQRITVYINDWIVGNIQITELGGTELA